MLEHILESLKTSSLDSLNESKKEYQHSLLSNKDKKMVSLIREELLNCDEFIFSIAFITESGVVLLLEQLKELEKEKVKGTIITGDYLMFTQPKALRKLLEFKNIKLKILTGEKFHAKGYFFRKNNIWNIIVGSSNLTQTALTVNYEWNLKITSLDKGKIITDILTEIEQINNKGLDVNIELLEEYENNYRKIKRSESFIKEEEKIIPNIIQQQALKNLEYIRKNEKRALLISATGTGKTFMSAFDIKNANPKKVLFIAHRNMILEKSKESYRKIFGNAVDENIKFVMIQTISKDEHLYKFSKNEFDYIVIDEIHHGGAKTYQKVINYFEPKFLLGLTATPERTDDFNIYELFDYNIAYEIRLHDALREELLVPFHYFGIASDEIEKKDAFSLEVKVNNIIEKSKFYGYSGDKLHCLIFVSSIEEAKKIEERLNELNKNAVALIGKDSDKRREEVVKKFEKGEIEYIITVDIFNEGIDIPCINQVIFLRPTESSIIYIQQLGRGLRKSEGKEYLVVLDFIGNYDKNFLIPVAISQDNSYDKDRLKQFILNGTDMLPGSSTITFDEISREKIIENINKTNFSVKKYIEQDFEFLEKKLGRIPFLNDFFINNLIDPSIILKYKKNYDEILKILKPKEKLGEISILENQYLTFLSIFFTPAKRIHEMECLSYLLENKSGTIDEINDYIENKYRLVLQYTNTKNSLEHLAKEIYTNLSTIKEYPQIIIKYGEKYFIEGDFEKSYFNNSYFKKLVDDLINYNISYVDKNYRQVDNETILRYKEYTKQEAFWYLNLDFNNGYQVSGYTVFNDLKKVILFITLDDTPPFSKFENEFFDTQHFTWFSKENRCIRRNNQLTNEGKILENYYKLFVFIKKKSGENFFYLGEVKKVLEGKEIINSKNKMVVEYILKLKHEIEKSLFDYLMMK